MGGSFGTRKSEHLIAHPFEDQVLGITKRPGMYTHPDNYYCVTTLITGLDGGQCGLVGFHQWLVVKLDGYNNVCWEASVLALSEEPFPQEIELIEDHKRAITHLGETLTQFFQDRHKLGLTKIYFDYANWLLKQDWYDGPLREQK